MDMYMYVSFQILNEFTCVRYLLNNIENNDPGLQVEIANVLDDVGTPTVPGKWYNFELAAAYLLLKDSVTKRCAAVLESKRLTAEITTTIVEEEDEIILKKKNTASVKNVCNTEKENWGL